MLKKIILFLSISFGAALAIQALFHPTLPANTRLVYLIAVIALVNTAIVSSFNFQYSLRDSSPSFFTRKYRALPKPEGDRRWNALQNVIRTSFQVSTLLALLAVNTLFFLEIHQTSYLIWILLAGLLIPVVITIAYQFWTNRQLKNSYN